MARLYGLGSLWLRKSKRHPEGEYWLRYYVAGKQRTENSEYCKCHDSRAESQAEKKLAKRIGEIQAGTLPNPRANRILVEDLALTLFKAQRVEMFGKIPENLPDPTRVWREKRAEEVLAITKGRWENHLQPVFGDRKASLIAKSDIDSYVEARQKAKARNGTINRELALLKRMYRYGFQIRPRLASDIPQFPSKLVESPRTGFTDDKGYNKLLREAKYEPGLKAMIMTAYRLGFRKNELMNVLVMQLADGWLRLFAGTTKNRKARAVKLPNDVYDELKKCAKGKRPDQHLFTWKNGDPILDFRGAWEKITKAAELPDLLFHDLRRSFVRRSRKKKIPVAVAMKISGHLTRKVFDDYDAANDDDVADAAKLL